MMRHPAPLVGALVLALLALAACDEAVQKPEAAPAPEPAPIELKNLDIESGYIWPELHLDAKNRSSKPIRAFTTWVTLKDGHGRPVSGLGNDRVFGASYQTYQDDEIAAGETIGLSVSLTWFNGARAVDESGVCLVTFADGTQWSPSEPEPNCE